MNFSRINFIGSLKSFIKKLNTLYQMLILQKSSNNHVALIFREASTALQIFEVLDLMI